MEINGYVFDFDGLILDTEMPIFTAWQRQFAKYGFSFTYEDYQMIIGSDHSKYDPAVDLSERLQGSISPQSLRDLVFAQAMDIVNKQPILPGVQNFLINAKKAKKKLAVASSSSRVWVEGHLLRLGLRDYFEVVCTSNDVKKVKPDPELYNLAIQKIGLQSDEVVVFEDSPNGIKAAKASGAKCVAVPNQITKNMDLTHADRIVGSFNELDPINLSRINF